MPPSPDRRRLALFGSTGSIGEQAIDVVNRLGRHRIIALAAHRNWERLAAQANELEPERVAIADESHFTALKDALTGKHVKVTAGADAAAEIAATADFDIALNGLVGVAGLKPSYETLRRGISLALANKESLVLAGELLNRICAETGAEILPVDSEHSALWQCLHGERRDDVRQLILTASGGPFRGLPVEAIQNATPAEALRHPTWKMGDKITIDSATLMNKGLEVIEAHHLFNFPPDQIAVVIHPESIVHSMVEFRDGSVKAQMGLPDMRLPIQYALTFPERSDADYIAVNPSAWPPLHFQELLPERYPCLTLAFRALSAGGTATAVLNGADEAAVGLFLKGDISFGDIPRIIDAALAAHRPQPANDLDLILEADGWGRRFISDFAGRMPDLEITAAGTSVTV